MELESYVREVAQQLTATAALGDDRVREVAAALATAAQPAVRLAILGALAAAADEITAALLDSPGSPAVAVHLDADDIRIAVTAAVAAASMSVLSVSESRSEIRAEASPSSARGGLGSTPAATRDGVSVNTWLVRVATATLNNPRQGAPTRHVTGWING